MINGIYSVYYVYIIVNLCFGNCVGIGGVVNLVFNGVDSINIVNVIIM